MGHGGTEMYKDTGEIEHIYTTVWACTKWIVTRKEISAPCCPQFSMALAVWPCFFLLLINYFIEYQQQRRSFCDHDASRQ